MIGTSPGKTTISPQEREKADSFIASLAEVPAKPYPLPTRFLGRQPILEANLHLHGYELLFRDGTNDAFSGDPETATQQVIDNYLLLMPDADQGKGFVNCTRQTLLAGLVTLLPPSNTVLEILEDVEPDALVLESCRLLRRRGYRFALDDFKPTESKRAFLAYADYIKVDFQASDEEERRAIYKMAAPWKSILLAEKIETSEEMQIALKEGCKLFQGYFFSRPSVLSHTVIPNNHLICLRLLALLSEELVNISAVESLVMMDTALCYRVLRLVNSALYSLNSRITSIRSALIVVGTDEFRKLITITLAGLFGGSNSKTLVSLAIERARFCETLSPVLNESGPKLYLLGMLSLIDAILKLPMSQIIDSLPLDDDMKAALQGEPSKIGVALELIRSYQAGDWDTCEELQAKLGIDERTTSRIYMDSVHWADKVSRV